MGYVVPITHDPSPITHVARNLELKVRCAEGDLGEVRVRLAPAGGEAPMTLRQVDTYFAVPNGRLKLRQTDAADGQSAELIAYARPDEGGARWSAYHRVAIAAEVADALVAALAAALGVRATVAKSREVWLRRHTRIHLDTVDGLGTFVELETVLTPDITEAAAAAELAAAAAILGLDRLPVVAGSYEGLVASAGC